MSLKICVVVALTSLSSQRFLSFFFRLSLVFNLVPSKPVGLEKGTVEDADISSSSVNGLYLAKYARLNEARTPGAWCSNAADASAWLQVLLGKQYTLTHIAIQGVNGNDVRAMTVKYEKTRDGEHWTTYGKSLGGNSNAKVLFLFTCLFVWLVGWLAG